VAVAEFLDWLLQDAVGPAAVALPVTWTASQLSGTAKRWFGRDSLSLLVRSAAGASSDLTRAEFDAVRLLLEDQRTWDRLGCSTVEELAATIAIALRACGDRSAEETYTAALDVARGLLKFTLAALDPELFQRLLLARIDRMRTDLARALDGTLLGWESDMAVLAKAHGELADDVTRALEEVFHRLPPGPAQRTEVAVYLVTLISQLNSDPWPRDLRINGPVLIPADIERRLRVISARKGTGRETGKDAEQETGADELAQRCRRLVILGSPGSGKTWLAKRTARLCAERALEALAAGQSLDEVELPLYTTCSRLFRSSGDIRHAVVSSAFERVPDMGSSRLIAALQVFFTERNTPTLLVIDSLDEAGLPAHADDPLDLARTLPWRIILTTRSTTWNPDSFLDVKNDDERVCVLQPLRYPGDVESLIQRWFTDRPERGRQLSAQIARRPAIQQAATVPLILTFYCIIGGDRPLPQFRYELYAKVLNRILTGRWRGSHNENPEPDACLEMLRSWAWSSATCDPTHGVGTWADEIRTRPSKLTVLDHVAAPVGSENIDDRKVPRRFIHRSIREYLVAEYVAGLPVGEAADALLPHLWYDPDWEFSAPAAIAMHPHRNELLQELLRRAARSKQFPRDLSVINAGREMSTLLVRVAWESGETCWSPENAEMIGRACVELACSAIDRGGAGYPWPRDLAAPPWKPWNRKCLDALHPLLTRQNADWKVRVLAETIAELEPDIGDRRNIIDTLLQLIGCRRDGWHTSDLPGSIAKIGPEAPESSRIIDTLLQILTSHVEADKRPLYHLVETIAALNPNAEYRRRTIDCLLQLLASHAGADGRQAEKLARVITTLNPDAERRCRALDILIPLLARRENSLLAKDLADTIAALNPNAEYRRHAIDCLLQLLNGQEDGEVARSLAGGIARLATAGYRHQTLAVLLQLLTRQNNARRACRLAETIAILDPSARDKCQAVEALVQLLIRQVDSQPARDLAHALAVLSPDRTHRRRAIDALFQLLACQDNGWLARSLASGIARLDPSARNRHCAIEVLILLFERQDDYFLACGLADGIAMLDPDAHDKHCAVDAIIPLLSRYHSTGQTALAEMIALLAPDALDTHRAIDALIPLLTDRGIASDLARTIARLDLDTYDRHRTIDALLPLLTSQNKVLSFDREHDLRHAHELANAIASLGPTVRDMSGWHTWAVHPSAELLAAARRNSSIDEWIAALHSFTSLSTLDSE
jgi:hypothetical protein